MFLIWLCVFGALEEIINWGSCYELWACRLPLPFVFLHFGHEALILHLELYIKKYMELSAPLVLCITSIEVIICNCYMNS